MARVTIEDCEKVPNRFQLTLLASERAKQLISGAPLTIDRGAAGNTEKNTVLALREIAAQTVNLDDLSAALVAKYRTAFDVPDATVVNDANMLSSLYSDGIEIDE